MSGRFLTILVLIFAAVFSRLVPHPWNLTAMGSVALFAGSYLRPRLLAWLVPLVAFLISDFILGLHSTIFFAYGALALITGLGIWGLKKPTALSVFALSLTSSLLFFLTTNFGVWWVDNFYPPTLAGLLQCFAMAIPFFKGQIIGDLFFSMVLFGSYELISRKIFQSQRQTLS